MKVSQEQRKLGQLKSAKVRAFNREAIKNGIRSPKAVKLWQAIEEIDSALKDLRAKPSRESILKYFEELCGPHLDPDAYGLTDEELLECYENSLREQSEEKQ